MHFASEFFAEIGVAELVQSLYEDETDIQQGDIRRRKDSFTVFLQLRPVLKCQLEPPPDHRQPDKGAKRADELPDKTDGLIEEVIRIEKRKAHEHDVQPARTNFPLLDTLEPAEQLR